MLILRYVAANSIDSHVKLVLSDRFKVLCLIGKAASYWRHFACFRIESCHYATVFALVLNSKVQTVNQTEEVGVTVGREAVTTLLHEVVRTVGVATEFWQYVGPGSYIVNNAVVTTVVERTYILEFQTCECHTGPGVFFVVFRGIALDLILMQCCVIEKRRVAERQPCAMHTD